MHKVSKKKNNNREEETKEKQKLRETEDLNNESLSSHHDNTNFC